MRSFLYFNYIMLDLNQVHALVYGMFPVCGSSHKPTRLVPLGALHIEDAVDAQNAKRQKAANS